MKKEQLENYSENERLYWLKRFSGNFRMAETSPYKKRDFISLMNYTQEELEALLAFTETIKRATAAGFTEVERPRVIFNKRVVMRH